MRGRESGQISQRGGTMRTFVKDLAYYLRNRPELAALLRDALWTVDGESEEEREDRLMRQRTEQVIGEV